MRFVDEFRDADKAHALAAKITALCEPGRQYKLMEVCGGHTHTIYKHGLEDYLPESITLVHGPGCPVCVIPMGRIDDAMHLAANGFETTTPSTAMTLLRARAQGIANFAVFANHITIIPAIKAILDSPDL